MNCIQVENLSKSYTISMRTGGWLGWLSDLVNPKTTTKLAVNGISFSVDCGEIVGFLGPNGAGKTTTLKMLSGLLHPTSGGVSVLGMEPRLRQREFLKSIALITGQRQQLIWDLPAMDTFKLNQAIYEVSDAEFRKTFSDLDDLLQIGELANKPVRTLSMGEKMKCELAAALLHEPKVLFLDEPTIGLDIEVQQTVRAFIKQYSRDRRAAVLLTSHYIKDVQQLCERVVVISSGKMSFDDTLAALGARVSDRRVLSIKTSRQVGAEEMAKYGEVGVSDGFSHEILVDVSDAVQVSSRVLSELPVIDISINEPPLEDALLNLFASVKSAAVGPASRPMRERAV
jgi:ABC-2 type transport system ATP-binding protein